MPIYSLILYKDIEYGKCYTISGSIASANGSVGSVKFRLGNENTSTLVVTYFNIGGTPTNITFNFDYYQASGYYDRLIIDAHADLIITDLSFKLNPYCATGYCSECFEVKDCEEITPETVYLEWTNDDDGFGIDYTSLKMIQSMTLVGGIRNMQYIYDEEYFSTSSGKHFAVYADSVKTVELWIHDVPEYIHDALRVAIVHDHFTVNGVEYTKEEGSYAPDWDTPNSLMAPVVIKLREKYQNTKNYNC